MSSYRPAHTLPPGSESRSAQARTIIRANGMLEEQRFLYVDSSFSLALSKIALRTY